MDKEKPKQIFSFYIEKDVIKELKKDSDNEERSMSYVINSILKKKYKKE